MASQVSLKIAGILVIILEFILIVVIEILWIVIVIYVVGIVSWMISLELFQEEPPEEPPSDAVSLEFAGVPDPSSSSAGPSYSKYMSQ